MVNIFRSLVIGFALFTASIGITSSAFAQQMQCGPAEKMQEEITKQNFQLVSTGLARLDYAGIKNAVVNVYADREAHWLEFLIFVHPEKKVKVACLFADGENWVNFGNTGEVAAE